MREIEIKAKVSNKDALLKKLTTLGVNMSQAAAQHDVVFCKPGQKDYEPGSVWLRIRTEPNGVTFTLKADTGRKLDSIEHETQVSNGSELKEMLLLMGYELYSDITKTRSKGTYKDISVCVDTVDGLGTYIEAEKMFNDHTTDYETAARSLWEFFAQLGVTPKQQETNGYDVLVLAQQTKNK